MSRPSARGPRPLSGVEFSECLEVLDDRGGTRGRFNHRDRRRARSKLRRYAKYIRKHVPEDQRSPVQNSFLKIAPTL